MQLRDQGGVFRPALTVPLPPLGNSVCLILKILLPAKIFPIFKTLVPAANVKATVANMKRHLRDSVLFPFY